MSSARMLDRMAGSLYHQRFRSLPEKVQAAIQKCQSPEVCIYPLLRHGYLQRVGSISDFC